jgi:large subunit ribosomal protein L21
MYAVIRAGGRQFRVAPGDVIKVDQKPSENGTIEFNDVLAVSGSEGAIGKPESGARVIGSVVEEGRGDKILVFHFKRKKQYKKLQGHRQPFTAVRITEISFDGQKFTAPDVASKPKKAKSVQEKEMSSKQTEQKADKKARTRVEGKASRGSKSRTDKSTARVAKKPTKRK